MTTEQSKSILSMLAKENYISYSKPIARKLGIDEAILFGELCSVNYRFDDEEFYYEQEKLMNDTCLTEYRLRNALKNLQSANLVTIIKKGLPAKNYYKLNADKLLEIIEEDKKSRSTSGVKFDTTRDSNFDTTRDSNFDTTLNKKEINKKEEVKTNINNVKESVLKEKSKHKYGEYQRILLTDDEYSKLCNEYGKDYINDVIERIDEYVEQNNNKNKYKNFYLVIKKAIRDKWSILNGIEKDYYDDENFF